MTKKPITEWTAGKWNQSQKDTRFNAFEKAAQEDASLMSQMFIWTKENERDELIHHKDDAVFNLAAHAGNVDALEFLKDKTIDSEKLNKMLHRQGDRPLYVASQQGRLGSLHFMFANCEFESFCNAQEAFNIAAERDLKAMFLFLSHVPDEKRQEFISNAASYIQDLGRYVESKNYLTNPDELIKSAKTLKQNLPSNFDRENLDKLLDDSLESFDAEKSASLSFGSSSSAESSPSKSPRATKADQSLAKNLGTNHQH